MRKWPFFCKSQWEGVILSESQWKAEAYWPLIWMESIWLQKGHSMFSHPHWKYLETSLKKFYFQQVTRTSCLLRSVTFYFVLTFNADNATGIATRFIEMKLSKSSCFIMFTVDQVWSSHKYMTKYSHFCNKKTFSLPTKCPYIKGKFLPCFLSV
jgi:hypothetical protein